MFGRGIRHTALAVYRAYCTSEFYTMYPVSFRVNKPSSTCLLHPIRWLQYFACTYPRLNQSAIFTRITFVMAVLDIISCGASKACTFLAFQFKAVGFAFDSPIG